MVLVIALTALLLETCLAFPPFSRGSYTLNVSGGRNGYDDNTVTDPDTSNSLSLENVMLQTLTNPGTNVVMSDRYEYTTNPSERGWGVFRTGLVSGAANMDPSGFLQQCMSLASAGMDQLLYCIKLISDTDQLRQSKRGPLKLNPTGWKRKKRSTNDDMQQQLDNIRMQSLLTQLLDKRQKAQPRFNPTGW